MSVAFVILQADWSAWNLGLWLFFTVRSTCIGTEPPWKDMLGPCSSKQTLHSACKSAPVIPLGLQPLMLSSLNALRHMAVWIMMSMPVTLIPVLPK